MKKTIQKTAQRTARHKRIRARVKGTAERPRLVVYRSNTRIYAQLINDETGHTLAAVDSKNEKGTMSERAKAVGAAIAKKATSTGVTTVVFDRGGYKYQGSVAALADAAREAGLTF